MLEDDYIGQTLFAKKRPKEDFVLYLMKIGERSLHGQELV